MSLFPAVGLINAPENLAVASRGFKVLFQLCGSGQEVGRGLTAALSWYEGISGCELGNPWSLYVEDVSVAANHHVLTTLEKFLAVG